MCSIEGMFLIMWACDESLWVLKEPCQADLLGLTRRRCLSVSQISEHFNCFCRKKCMRPPFRTQKIQFLLAAHHETSDHMRSEQFLKLIWS